MSTVPEHPYYDDDEVRNILTNPTCGLEVHDIID